MVSNIVFIRDFLKRSRASLKHTIDSASVLSHEGIELTDLDLEHVIGGMSREDLQKWRVNMINRKTLTPWEES
jgi:hypothetical protein